MMSTPHLYLDDVPRPHLYLDGEPRPHLYLDDVPRLLSIVALHVLTGWVWAEQLDRCFYDGPHLQVYAPSLRVGESNLQ